MSERPTARSNVLMNGHASNQPALPSSTNTFTLSSTQLPSAASSALADPHHHHTHARMSRMAQLRQATGGVGGGVYQHQHHAYSFLANKWLTFLGCVGISTMLLIGIMGQYQSNTIPIAQHSKDAAVEGAVKVADIAGLSASDILIAANNNNTPSLTADNNLLHQPSSDFISSPYQLYTCHVNNMIDAYTSVQLQHIEDETQDLRKRLLSTIMRLQSMTVKGVSSVDMSTRVSAILTSSQTDCMDPQKYGNDGILCSAKRALSTDNCMIVLATSAKNYDIAYQFEKETSCHIHVLHCHENEPFQKTALKGRVISHNVCYHLQPIPSTSASASASDNKNDDSKSSWLTPIADFNSDVVHHLTIDISNIYEIELISSLKAYDKTLPYQLTLIAPMTDTSHHIEYLLVYQHLLDLGYRFAASTENDGILKLTALRFVC
jgi:hypothetical protein